MKTDNELIAEFMGFIIAGEEEDGIYPRGTLYHPESFAFFQLTRSGTTGK